MDIKIYTHHIIIAVVQKVLKQIVKIVCEKC